jgi:hypothetical protein
MSALSRGPQGTIQKLSRLLVPFPADLIIFTRVVALPGRFAHKPG